MKTLIAFFYLMNGEVVSYTVSDFEVFKATEGIPGALACEDMIQNQRFAADVRAGLKPGEAMRAECHYAATVGPLGDPFSETTIALSE